MTKTTSDIRGLPTEYIKISTKKAHVRVLANSYQV